MTRTYPVIQLTIGGGTILTFSGPEVVNATLVEQINPLGIELPSSTMEFGILNHDSTFSMFEGAYFKLLSERLPLLVYENVNGVNQFLGKFYLASWENVSEHEMDFRAIDVIGVLAATAYDGGFWSVPTALSVVMAGVFNPINVLFTIAPAIAGVLISGWIPPGDYRKALQQICFAAKATASTAGSATLDITPVKLPTMPLFDHLIADKDKIISQSIKLTPLVTSIELISHDYTQGTVIEDIYSKTLDAGTHKIIFEKPYYNIVVNGPGYTPTTLITEGGDDLVTENSDYIEIGGQYVFGPNSLYLDMTAAGLVTITGYPWIDSKKGYSFVETGVTEYANLNALQIADATMINADNAQEILDQVREYYRQRYMQTVTLLPSVVEVGDVIVTSALYQKELLAKVQKMDMNLTGGFLAKTDILGISFPLVQPLAHPVRRPRTGIAVSGERLTRQNMFRNY